MPDTEAPTASGASETDGHPDDDRPDIVQAVEARSDAVARGEGGAEPATFTDAALPDGPAGTGGVVKNQDDDAQ